MVVYQQNLERWWHKVSSFKSEIAPKGLQFYPSEFFISDKYATILTVVSYPKFIPPGYLSNLTSMPGIKIVIKHIPVPFSTVSRMLNKQIAELKQKYQDERDRTMQERIRMDYESLESFVTPLHMYPVFALISFISYVAPYSCCA